MQDAPRIYRFGDIEVDTAAHRVLRDGEPLALEPKAYAVLLALLAKPGYAMLRDELLDQVWGHRHVTPGVLNRVVAQLRKALGDEAEHPRYIQTLHAVGYRFMCAPEVLAVEEAPVVEISREAHDAEIFQHVATAAPEPPPKREPGPEPRPETPPETQPEQDPLRAHAHAHPRRARARRAMRVATLVLLAVLVALAAIALWRTSPPGTPAARDGAAIALRPFTVLGGGADDAWFAEGLAVEMHDALASVPGLRVAALMPPTDPRRDEDVRELGRVLGVDAILDASIRREGGRIRVNASLSDTRSGYVLWSRSYEHSMAGVFAIQVAIAGEVVESMLGAMPGARESLRARLAPTRSVAAFNAYLRGRQLALGPRDRKRSGEAAAAFRAALAEDADFALAHAALCTTETHRFEYWNDSDAHARARAACARAAELVPLPPEAALAIGNLHRVDGAFDAALASFRQAAEDPASAALAEVGMARTEAARGDRAAERAHFARALELAPEDARIRAESGFQAYRDGRLGDAVADYRASLELGPDSAGNWNTYGFLLLLSGDTRGAEQAFERSIALEPSADVLANFGTLRAQSGDHASAVALYRRALELDPDDYINWGNLGDGLRQSGAAAGETAQAYAEAERRARRYLALEPGDGYAMAALGWYGANLGRREEALDMVRRARESGRGDPAEIALYNAETLAVLGDREASRRELARARGAGMDEARIRTSAAAD